MRLQASVSPPQPVRDARIRIRLLMLCNARHMACRPPLYHPLSCTDRIEVKLQDDVTERTLELQSLEPPPGGLHFMSSDDCDPLAKAVQVGCGFDKRKVHVQTSHQTGLIYSINLLPGALPPPCPPPPLGHRSPPSTLNAAHLHCHDLTPSQMAHLPAKSKRSGT